MADNRFLAALTPECRAQTLKSARLVELPAGTSLEKADETPQFVYLLTTGVASYVVAAGNGGSAEVGMCGAEAIIGAAALLGPAPPVANCTMQIDGSAYRILLSEMRRLFDESPEIRQRVLQSVQHQVLWLCQVAGCNRLHEASARLARWLLTASDRAGTSSLRLTQETLAQMLGTRRTTVALVAGTLQRRGLIRYRRGLIQIVDRERLAEAACSCYTITQRATDRLYGDPSPTT